MNPIKRMAGGFRWVVLLCALIPANGLALSGDRDKPMRIEADRAELDDRKGVSVYQGKVQVTQGSMLLNADILTVHNRNSRITMIIAEGKPAHFQQRPENQTEDVKAQAERIEYDNDRSQIILSGGARVWQAGNVFQSDRIIYDIQRNVVHAGGEHSEMTEEQRVRITIQPKNSPLQSNPSQDSQ